MLTILRSELYVIKCISVSIDRGTDRTDQKSCKLSSLSGSKGRLPSCYLADIVQCFCAFYTSDQVDRGMTIHTGTSDSSP